jgi:hypothetical protein
LAAVIAGALVGRSIAGMIANLGLATTAVTRLLVALRAASTLGGVATAISGLSAAAGPLGLVIGATVVGALALFSRTSKEATLGADVYAEALKRVRARADEAATSIDTMSAAQRAGYAEKVAASIVVATKAQSDLAREFEGIIALADDWSMRDVVSPKQIEQMRGLSDDFRTGKIDAEQLARGLSTLAKASPGGLGDLLDGLIADLRESIAATRDLKTELASVAAPSFRSSENASIAAYDKMVAAGEQFVADATKRANLTKDQLALEKEIAEVRKEAAAAGVTLSDKQVSSLAQTRLAGDAARTSEGKAPKALKATADSRFDQDLQYVRDRTAALVAEQETIGQGLAVQESRRVQLDLEAQALADLREEARRKGETDLESIQLAPDQIAAIHDVADAYGEQVAALDKAQKAFADANEISRGFADDMVSGLLNGASAAEALADALGNVADKLLDMALDSLFDSNGGGLLATLFKGFSNGGAVGFAGGGYTGAGGKYQPAGVVHRGEYVFDQAAVRAAGGPAVLDAMRRGLKGYATGGLVGQAPRLPSLAGAASGAGGGVINFAPVTNIDATGSQVTKQEIDGMLRQRDRALMVAVKTALPGMYRDSLKHGHIR